MNSIEITSSGTIRINHLESINQFADRIELIGTGALAICTLTFFNGDEQSMDEYQNIIFTKTDHPTQYILTPHKVINLSDYAYCYLKIFSGNLHPDDKVLLYYKPAQNMP